MRGAAHKPHGEEPPGPPADLPPPHLRRARLDTPPPPPRPQRPLYSRASAEGLRTPRRDTGEAAEAAEGPSRWPSLPPLSPAPLTAAGPPSTEQRNDAAWTFEIAPPPPHVTRPARSHWQVRTITAHPRGILGLVVGWGAPTAVGVAERRGPGRAGPGLPHTAALF